MGSDISEFSRSHMPGLRRIRRDKSQFLQFIRAIARFLPEMRISPAHIQSSMHTQGVTPRARAKLTLSDALDIYNCKGSDSSAAAVSKLYCVSEKTVRDIWTGRTWSKETWHLDESRTLKIKKMGRPLGRKDAQPRKPRVLRPITESFSWSQGPAHISPESQSTDIESIFRMSIIERLKKVTDEVPASACCGHDKTIDNLLHEKALCGFDTAFEDPFGPDWAAVLCSFHQAMQQ